ncbi:hypothetical protein ACFWVC_22600 [Streptomyces sp. NPDC058691]|uniref:hypothetical protein n=1 Tax=Streptomyces sp. NPDC058691 TaxID=3346601 RepID=UPI003654D440
MCVTRLFQELWARRPVRWVITFVAGALWWWAMVRLTVQPAKAGPLEGLVAAGGWGLSIIPMHSARWSRGPDGAVVPVREDGASMSRWPWGRVPGPRSRSLPGHDDSAVAREKLARHDG